jgi:hypothetical protein
MKRVPDLHYIVVRSHTVFSRRGHLTVFFRHDKDGRKFIYHVEAHYGFSGRDPRRCHDLRPRGRYPQAAPAVALSQDQG